MGGFVKGDVVVIPFPFSNLTATKRRPALVILALPGEDIILCQITSKLDSNSLAIPIISTDFIEGGLNRDSHIRPERLFTADSQIALYRAGKITTTKLQETVDAMIRLITS